MDNVLEGIGKILIYRCGTIGDTIVSIPAINILRNHFNKSNFILMTAHNDDGKIWADDVLGEFKWFNLKELNNFKDEFIVSDFHLLRQIMMKERDIDMHHVEVEQKGNNLHWKSIERIE